MYRNDVIAINREGLHTPSLPDAARFPTLGASQSNPNVVILINRCISKNLLSCRESSVVTIDHSGWRDSQAKPGGLRQNGHLIQGRCICVIFQMMRWTARERLIMYEQVQAMNSGFERVQLAFGELRRIRGVDRSELAVFVEFTDEARATALSYLTELIESAETECAGRLFRRRQARDREREGSNE